MASNTYSLISTITTTGTTTVSFTSIPQTYTDLVLRFMIKNSNSATSSALNITFNSDSTSTNYSSEILRSDTDTGQN